MISRLPREGVPSGGAARYTERLARMLAPLAEVTVVADVGCENGQQAFGVRPTWRAPVLSAHALKKTLRELKPDVVHVQHELTLYGSLPSTIAFPFWLRSIAHAYPTAVTVHGVLPAHAIDSALFAGRVPGLAAHGAPFALRSVFAGIAHAPAIKAAHGASLAGRLVEYGALPRDVAVVPIIASLDSAAPTRAAARDRLGIPQDAKVVLAWGFLNVYKGFDRVLEGFALFREREPAAMLLLNVAPHPSRAEDRGQKREHAALERRAREMGGVRFSGFISDADLPAYVAAADVAIFAYTRYVAASGCITDTVALGTPVLVSSVFEDAPPALTFVPTPEGAAQRLTRFFASPQSTIVASTQLVAERSAAHVVRAHGALYERSLQRFAGT
ncbi:MAG: glycosyltransferase family 4 protein [Candidatus Tyrphobacter sp.]